MITNKVNNDITKKRFEVSFVTIIFHLKLADSIRIIPFADHCKPLYCDYF